MRRSIQPDPFPCCIDSNFSIRRRMGLRICYQPLTGYWPISYDHTHSTIWKEKFLQILLVMSLNQDKDPYFLAIFNKCAHWIYAYAINHYWFNGQYHLRIPIHRWYILNFTQISSNALFDNDLRVLTNLYSHAVFMNNYNINRNWTTDQYQTRIFTISIVYSYLIWTFNII